MIPTEMKLSLSETTAKVVKRARMFTTVPVGCWVQLLCDRTATSLHDTLVFTGLSVYLTMLVFMADTFANHVTGHHHIPVTMLGVYSAHTLAFSPATPNSLALPVLGLAMYLLGLMVVVMHGVAFLTCTMVVGVGLVVWKSAPQPPRVTHSGGGGGGMRRPVIRSVTHIPVAAEDDSGSECTIVSSTRVGSVGDAEEVESVVSDQSSGEETGSVDI